mmetsp:Transcript_9082/g.20596  ORF Transcript_9082/g.20596 Transcript_9082/m.20596 type:complete len:222 (+) Transcript_9082:1187-1852(+)
MNTRRTKSLIARDFCIMSCCSKGAMPGTNKIERNSMSPSTAKCVFASGSRNSLNVDLKNSLYDSCSTSLGERTQIGLSLFAVDQFSTCSYSFFITGLGSGSVNSSPLASASIFFFVHASFNACVDAVSSTSFSLFCLAHTSMGNEINSEYVLTSEESFSPVAYSSHPSFKCRTIFVPRVNASSLSLTVYELELISDSQTHVAVSLGFLDVTVILSATKNAE